MGFHGGESKQGDLLTEYHPPNGKFKAWKTPKNSQQHNKTHHNNIGKPKGSIGQVKPGNFCHQIPNALGPRCSLN